jgi:hypothetical protein
MSVGSSSPPKAPAHRYLLGGAGGDRPHHIDRINGRNVVGLEVSGIARRSYRSWIPKRPHMAPSLSTFGGEASGPTPVIRTRGDRNQLFHP